MFKIDLLTRCSFGNGLFHTNVNKQDGESRGSSDSEGELFSSSSAAEGRQSLPGLAN